MNMFKVIDAIEEHKVKILNDAFAGLIENDCKQKGKIVNLGYVFQSHGIYLHEYVSNNSIDNEYFIISSNIKSELSTYKLKDKSQFECLRDELRKSIGKAEPQEITFDYSEMKRRDWKMIFDIDILYSYVAIFEIDGDKIFEFKIDPNVILIGIDK